MTKIAVIYTGQVRTIETTITLFKQNVLKNNNYHVFAVLEKNNINHQYYENILKENINENLKSLIWLNNDDKEWSNIKKKLLDDMVNINDEFKKYLSSSGSMIEYYQAYIANQQIIKYENENEFKYDFVLRMRSDVVLKDDIKFNMEDINKNYIRELLNNIKIKLNKETIIDKDIFELFMNVFMIKDRYNYFDINSTHNKITDDSTFKIILNNNNEELYIDKIYDYIHTSGNYIITLRMNVVYFMKRDLFTYISNLGITYGKYNIYNINDNWWWDNNYWWNAESQLRNICFLNNIDYYTSVTYLEDKSLYEYNKNNYYSSNDKLLNNQFSFFIKRK